MYYGKYITEKMLQYKNVDNLILTNGEGHRSPGKLCAVFGRMAPCPEPP